jgi:hypothetical protein
MSSEIPEKALLLQLPPGLQRRPGQILAALLERGLGLGGALGDFLLQRGHLQLNPLARGGDVRDTASYPGQHLDLLLVRVVQGLARVFHPVQRLVGLGPEYQRDSLHHAHRRGRPLHFT